MKKIAVLAVATVLVGCTSNTETLEIVSSTSQEVYSAEQIAAMNEANTQNSTTINQQQTTTEVVQTAPSKPKAEPKPKYQYVETAKHGYTIQVLALSHNQGFTTYMNKLPSNEPVWTNKKTVDGLPWYTLLFGHYETREQAKRALNALPKDVKAFGPFIRKIDDIKASNNPKLTKLN
ncbi:DamX-related protein [Photobacterium jeanii]|uniref:DamX-related protein n=1 Tax=Photobacterium jeanii TaxID=858640 RepID=A0A178K2N5_9GAMM|nr:SPOR domain-containing protein [Photobacterium jeanii]OAN11568.1 DamX-related protein [Photobacterium jeanii]PST91091.1 DamX-related protein [Photobacterium jeanii]